MMMTKRKSVSTTAAIPMEREMQALIGHRLRARYTELMAEPIPDKFMDLLEQLDRPAPSPVRLAVDGFGVFGAREEHRR
jgi:hypothetical protein